MNTDCGECIFAEREGGIQVGCELGRLEKLRMNGAELARVDDHFVVAHRFCNAVRNAAWAEGKPAGELRRLAEAEFSGQFTMIIHVGDGATEDDLRDSLASVAAQTMAPKAVKVLFPADHGRAPHLNLAVRRSGVDCRVHRVLAPTPEQDAEYDHDPVRRAVDVAVAESATVYYTAARAGFRWPADFVRRVDHAVNVEMMRVLAILPDGDGMAAMVSQHNSLGGNRHAPFLEKVLTLAEEQGMRHLLHSWGDLPCVS